MAAQSVPQFNSNYQATAAVTQAVRPYFNAGASGDMVWWKGDFPAAGGVATKPVNLQQSARYQATKYEPRAIADGNLSNKAGTAATCAGATGGVYTPTTAQLADTTTPYWYFIVRGNDKQNDVHESDLMDADALEAFVLANYTAWIV